MSTLMVIITVLLLIIFIVALGLVNGEEDRETALLQYFDENEVKDIELSIRYNEMKALLEEDK